MLCVCIYCYVFRTGGIHRHLQTITAHGMLSCMTGFTVMSTRIAIWFVLFFPPILNVCSIILSLSYCSKQLLKHNSHWCEQSLCVCVCVCVCSCWVSDSVHCHSSVYSCSPPSFMSTFSPSHSASSTQCSLSCLLALDVRSHHIFCSPCCQCVNATDHSGVVNSWKTANMQCITQVYMFLIKFKFFINQFLTVNMLWLIKIVLEQKITTKTGSWNCWKLKDIKIWI